MSHTLLNYAFLLFWSIFGEILWELFFLDINVTIAETSTEKLRNLIFLPCSEGPNSEENLDLFKQLFMIKQVKEDKYYKTCFLQKVRHIKQNYAFLLFWSIFGEFMENFFFNIKVTIAETSTEKLSHNVFLTMFERFIWICLNNPIFEEPFGKGININKNGFSPQSGPHSAKLCLSFFFKAFWGIFIENFSF